MYAAFNAREQQVIHYSTAQLTDQATKILYFVRNL